MPDVHILHLSDLHFGPHSRFHGEDPTRLGKAFHRALREACKRTGFEDKVDLVVMTGDVAETAKPKEFAAGAAFLTGLAGALGLEHRRFVFVPGNHDVSWPACKKVAAEQEEEDFDENELRRRLDAVKLGRYEEFLRGFYNVSDLDEVAQPLGRGARLYGFPELRLQMAALNTCEVESHRPADHRGVLSRGQAQAVMDAWRVGEPALRVVALHHNPVATTRANVESWRRYLAEKGEVDADLIARFESDVVGCEGREHLQALVSDCHVQLVLHGHHHARDEQSFNWKSDGRAHVLSAGSLTLQDDHLPKDEPASARLVRLAPEERMIAARSLVYLGWARTEGEVTWGAFVADSAEGDGYRQALDVPPGFELAKNPEEDPEEDLEEVSQNVDPAFVHTYRDRLRAAFSRWDLAMAGVAQAGGAGRPIEATLDEMYLPLRFDSTFEIDKTNLGRPIAPEDLLQRDRSLAIRGPGGSGKTTWMRWTFRRLLELDRALPIMLVLRDLARRWQEPGCTGEKRSLDAFLDGWVGEHLGKGWEGDLGKLFKAPGGLRPVLLVDGWDELGELGEELRRKLLGLMEQFPRLLVVASSRPYGEGRPSGSEDFQELDIQPLADGEVRVLARRFFAHCYGKDEASAVREAEHFQTALERSPEAQALARTALLLTMMLLISRSRPLPDKRHLLYEACVENLLTALPDRKEREGAQLLREQWRPKDSEERMRMVAALAFKMQERGYKKTYLRSAVVRSWDEVATLLPEEWNQQRKSGFLNWLAGPAALLADRADGTLAFTHLSFQEYLTAWHLNANVEGKKRAEIFCERLASETWWETLLLWAALIERQSQERLEVVFEALREKRDLELAVAGMMLADGLGTSQAFERWLQWLVESVESHWPENVERCTRAWAASRQEERRQRLAETLMDAAPHSGWLRWLRFADITKDAGLQEKVQLPESPLIRRLVTANNLQAHFEELDVAAGRVLCGSIPLWPPDKLGVLQVWPSYRRVVGLRLQIALACGAAGEDIRKIARALLRQPKWTEKESGLARDWARDLAHDWARDWARDRTLDWARDVARELARDWARDWARDSALVLTRGLARDWTRYLARYLARDLARYWAGYLARDLSCDWARDWTRDLACYWARDLMHDFVDDLARDWSIKEKWLEHFALADLFSFGRSAARPFLSRATGGPEVRLLASASRVSLDPKFDPTTLQETLKETEPTLDPLWPALARHLARRSTPADCDLLIDLAQHPEKRDPPLQWGLRYIVRGDVMTDDGTIVTLDELCDDLGLPRLPYLDEMPDEIEI